MAVARLQHFGESVPRATMETNENEFVARIGVDGRFTYVDPRYHSFGDHKAGGPGITLPSHNSPPPPFPPLPPPTQKKNLEIEYGYYFGAISVSYLKFYMLLNITMCHQNVVWKVFPRLRLKQSERF